VKEPGGGKKESLHSTEKKRDNRWKENKALTQDLFYAACRGAGGEYRPRGGKKKKFPLPKFDPGRRNELGV